MLIRDYPFSLLLFSRLAALALRFSLRLEAGAFLPVFSWDSFSFDMIFMSKNVIHKGELV